MSRSSQKRRGYSKVGRPRGDGEREPNGRLSRATRKVVDTASPAQVRRLRDAALAGMRDPAYGSELGRLFLAYKLDSTQFAAAKRWASLARAYRQHQGIPQPTPRGADLEREPGRETRARPSDVALEVIADYTDAYAALAATGYFARTIVEAVCERDCAVIDESDRGWLRRGLNALAVHWGL